MWKTHLPPQPRRISCRKHKSLSFLRFFSSVLRLHDYRFVDRFTFIAQLDFSIRFFSRTVPIYGQTLSLSENASHTVPIFGHTAP